MGEEGTVVPFFVTLDAYVRKGVGIDMMLKSLLGVFRIMAMYSNDAEMSKNYAAVAHSIVNCRMLANHFRHIMSFSFALKVLEKKEGALLSWLTLFLSFFFRSLEQVYGDLNYYQMLFMRHWSRKRLTLGYHFFKSLSLTCGLLNELTRVHRIAALRKSERTKALKDSIISIVRYLCDMAVYYQWVPWYNPSKPMQYVCGSTAGFLGVYVVWNETKNALITPAKPPKTETLMETLPIQKVNGVGKIHVNGDVNGNAKSSMNGHTKAPRKDESQSTDENGLSVDATTSAYEQKA